MRVTLLIPTPPAGPVPASTMRRTSCGSVSAMTWAIMPPIEKPNEVHPFEPEGADEHDHVGGHRLDRGGCRAARRADAAVVERDDMAARRDGVDDPWVPVVEHGGEVGQHDDRHPAARSQLAVGDVDTATREPLRGHGRPDLAVARRGFRAHRQFLFIELKIILRSYANESRRWKPAAGGVRHTDDDGSASTGVRTQGRALDAHRGPLFAAPRCCSSRDPTEPGHAAASDEGTLHVARRQPSRLPYDHAANVFAGSPC